MRNKSLTDDVLGEIISSPKTALEQMLALALRQERADSLRSLEAISRLNNVMYRWTSCLSYNVSYVGEPSGLFKSSIRAIEKICDACRESLKDEVSE